MKVERWNLRVDPETAELLRKASEASGLSISDIVRSGAMKEAIRLIGVAKQDKKKKSWWVSK